MNLIEKYLGEGNLDENLLTQITVSYKGKKKKIKLTGGSALDVVKKITGK